MGINVTVLRNGGYVVHSIYWNGGRGAVTWGSGASGVKGEVSAANSLVGSSISDMVGVTGTVELTNGNFAVGSSLWNGGRGAVTWGSGAFGVKGEVSPANSLVGNLAGYTVGMNIFKTDIMPLDNGNYAVRAYYREDDGLYYAGVITLADGALGTAGLIAPSNSVFSAAAGGRSFMSANYDTVRSRFIVGDVQGHRLSFFDFTPEISVRGNSQEIPNGGILPRTVDHTDFGIATTGGGMVARTFTIWNTGRDPLNFTGASAVTVSGDNASDFIVTAQPAASVSSDEFTTFEVTFTPKSPGLRTASLSIANNDSDEALFDFAVQGRGWSVIEEWRSAYFGGAVESMGNLEDFDADGVVNLLEFAFGTLANNKTNGPEALRYAGTFAGGGTVAGAGQPVTLFESRPEGVDFRAAFTRRKDHAAAGLSYTPQFSADLVTWQDSTIVPDVLADDGSVQIAAVPFPSFIEGKKPCFFRVSVSIAP